MRGATPRWRRRLRALPTVTVVLVILIGLLVVARDEWRIGSGILAGAALLGAVLRATLPTRWIGPLAVRSRAFDVAIFVALTAVLASMALITVTARA